MQASPPEDALLARYTVSDDGTPLPHYTDCFSAQVSRAVDIEAFLHAFYTTPLFRCERLILRLFGLRSTDAGIDTFLAGRQQRFAAWTLEDRSDDQLLMCDVYGRTRSWFRVAREGTATRLYFGSAVVADGARLPMLYRALLPAHRFYSRQLLNAAARKLTRS